jgi:hypothetical protein
MNSGARKQKRRVAFARMSGRASKGAFIQSCKPSSSFHEEAIADCLEFIKRNSMSAEGSGVDTSIGAPRG